MRLGGPSFLNGVQRKVFLKSAWWEICSEAQFFFSFFQNFEDSSFSLVGGVQEHEVAKSPRTLLCPQRRVSRGAVSVVVSRTNIFTHAAQVSRGQHAQALQSLQKLSDVWRTLLFLLFVALTVFDVLWPACGLRD